MFSVDLTEKVNLHRLVSVSGVDVPDWAGLGENSSKLEYFYRNHLEENL